MKKNGIFVLTILLLIQPLRGEENKIVQLLHVKKDKTHLTFKPSDVLYYIKNNSIFYQKINQNDNSDIDQSENPIKLYEQSEKDGKYRQVQGRVVLIGQPVKIGTDLYTDFNNNSQWTMPAVIKKPGILGTILRPDIYTIEYKEIGTSTIDTNPEPLLLFKTPKKFKTPKNVELETEKVFTEYKYKFVITKQYEGHRTPVTKVGIVKNDDTFTIYSGSEWPTVKSRILNSTTYKEDTLKNQYLIAVNEQLSIFAYAKKNFFGPSKWTLTFNKKAPNDLKIHSSSLPNIVLNPEISTSKKYLYNLLDQYRNSSNLNDNVLHESNSNEYCLYIPYENNNKNKHYVVTLKKEQSLINRFYESDESKIYKTKFRGVQIAKENELITAHTFDFTHKKLFYAIYNKKTKISSIKKLNTDSVNNDDTEPNNNNDTDSSSEE